MSQGTLQGKNRQAGGITSAVVSAAVEALHVSVAESVALTAVVTPATANTATDPSQTTVGTSGATALAANANRKGLCIQNCGTTRLKVLLGEGTISQSNYTVCLPACGSANDGSSPPYYGQLGILWTGRVQWISSGSGGLGQAQEYTQV